MPSRIQKLFSRLSLSLFVLWSVNASAQLADDFFHTGAQEYLSNNIPAAKLTVTNGLARFPDDEKLKKLNELLNQQQQSQQDQQDQKDKKQDQKNDQQQDQKQDQKKKDDQKKDQSQQGKDGKDGQPKKDEQSQSDAQKKAQQKKQKEEQAKAEKSKEQEAGKKEAGEPQPITAHAMTPQEAKQLLDAQKGDEQVLIFQPQEPKNPDKKLNDW